MLYFYTFLKQINVSWKWIITFHGQGFLVHLFFYVQMCLTFLSTNRMLQTLNKACLNRHECRSQFLTRELRFFKLEWHDMAKATAQGNAIHHKKLCWKRVFKQKYIFENIFGDSKNEFWHDFLFGRLSSRSVLLDGTCGRTCTWKCSVTYFSTESFKIIYE